MKFDQVLSEFVGVNATHGPLAGEPDRNQAEVQLRVGVRGEDRKAVERFTKEIAPLILTGPPAVTGFAGGRPKVEEIMAYFPALIPKSLIEAAAIDGAGPVRRFFSIVFPLLSPTSFFLLVINIVYAFFGTFGVVDATTQGGPAGSTQILVYKVYHDGVKAADLGGSAAQSVILMIIVISLTVIQFKFVEKKVQY